jgi:hypothetical protein
MKPVAIILTRTIKEQWLIAVKMVNAPKKDTRVRIVAKRQENNSLNI